VRDKMLKIPELDEATARKIGDFIQKKANVTSRFGNQLLSGTDMMLSLKVSVARNTDEEEKEEREGRMSLRGPLWPCGISRRPRSLAKGRKWEHKLLAAFCV